MKKEQGKETQEMARQSETPGPTPGPGGRSTRPAAVAGALVCTGARAWAPRGPAGSAPLMEKTLVATQKGYALRVTRNV